MEKLKPLLKHAGENISRRWENVDWKFLCDTISKYPEEDVKIFLEEFMETLSEKKLMKSMIFVPCLHKYF